MNWQPAAGFEPGGLQASEGRAIAWVHPVPQDGAVWEVWDSAEQPGGDLRWAANGHAPDIDRAKAAAEAAVAELQYDDRQPPYREAGLLSYYAGMLGAIAFMATGIGPGWLGFLAAFVPAIGLAAWVVDRS